MLIQEKRDAGFVSLGSKGTFGGSDFLLMVAVEGAMYTSVKTN